MKRYILAILAVGGLFFAGCSILPSVTGSGFPQSTNYKYTKFTKVDATTGFHVQVVPDSAYSVEAITDDNIVQYLQVTQTGDTVTFALDPGVSLNNVTLMAIVHMPSIAEFDLSGGAQIRVDTGFSSAGPLAVTASGGAVLTITSIAAGQFKANASGGSSVTAAGSLSAESITASGGSTIDVSACGAPEANVNISGGSNAYVDVGSGNITLNASGGSTLYHKGAPTFTISDLSGGSEIKQIN